MSLSFQRPNLLVKARDKLQRPSSRQSNIVYSPVMPQMSQYGPTPVQTPQIRDGPSCWPMRNNRNNSSTTSPTKTHYDGQTQPARQSRAMSISVTPQGVILQSHLPQRPQTPQWPQPPQRIYFYHSYNKHYGFTNFSAHAVTHEEKIYPTSEHLFQSFKFKHRPSLAEHIRLYCPHPANALSEARRFQPEVRPDWMTINIFMMNLALWHKFTQHLDLRAELLGTGDAELTEDSDKDSFRGVGADRKGRDELGKAPQRLRAELRLEDSRRGA